MASNERISIPLGENGFIRKAKYQALLDFKGLFVAVEQPESAEMRKAPKQAKAG